MKLIDQNVNKYSFRCKGKEKLSIEKNRKVKKKIPKPKPDKSFLYPNLNKNEIISKTFQIKYEQRLPLITKLVLNSCHNKYLYYAIDDILYLLNLNSIESNNILAILYSPVLSLQNNLSISFFDIWIQEIYISEVSKVNKFLNSNYQNLESFSYITIKLLYTTQIPTKKEELLW